MDRHVWSLLRNRIFLFKSLSNHLSTISPLDTQLGKALWKSSSPRRVNILVWNMLVGHLNGSLVMQQKLPTHCLSPSICPLCLAESEDLQHIFYIFFDCHFSKHCWEYLFPIFNTSWVFGNVFRQNVLQVLVGPSLKSRPKALLAELWFERN